MPKWRLGHSDSRAASWSDDRGGHVKTNIALSRLDRIKYSCGDQNNRDDSGNYMKTRLKAVDIYLPVHRLIDRLIDWLIDRLIDWLNDWLIDWLIDWFIHSFNHSIICTHWLVHSFARSFVRLLVLTSFGPFARSFTFSLEQVNPCMM